jgi:hypothetical protein
LLAVVAAHHHKVAVVALADLELILDFQQAVLLL